MRWVLARDATTARALPRRTQLADVERASSLGRRRGARRRRARGGRRRRASAAAGRCGPGSASDHEHDGRDTVFLTTSINDDERSPATGPSPAAGAGRRGSRWRISPSTSRGRSRSPASTAPTTSTAEAPSPPAASPGGDPQRSGGRRKGGSADALRPPCTLRDGRRTRRSRFSRSSAAAGARRAPGGRVSRIATSAAWSRSAPWRAEGHVEPKTRFACAGAASFVSHCARYVTGAHQPSFASSAFLSGSAYFSEKPRIRSGHGSSYV